MSHEPNGVLDPSMDSASKHTNTLIERFQLDDIKSKTFGFSCPFYSSPTDKLSRPPSEWGAIDACKEYSEPKYKLDQ